MSYQDRDYEVIDYEIWQHPRVERCSLLRGPAPQNLEPGSAITFIGAAQTFGCYVEDPFPTVLGRRFQRPALNFGKGGAGPTFFLDRPDYLKVCNEGAYAVVQVMSGRSESNSLITANGNEAVYYGDEADWITAEVAWQRLIDEHSEEGVLRLLAETREQYIRAMRELLDAITVPKILFWFSTRTATYSPDLESARSLFGEFPQLVDDSWFQPLLQSADLYCEVVSNRGLPQPLTNRFTGEDVEIPKRNEHGGGVRRYNSYYPSPEMHEEAALALTVALAELMGEMDQLSRILTP